MNNELYIGMKFISKHFNAAGEIIAIRKDENEIDILLTPSDGHAWIEKSWNLEYVESAFEKGHYFEAPKNEVNISIQ